MFWHRSAQPSGWRPNSLAAMPDESRLDSVRSVMLQALEDCPHKRSVVLARRIRHTDVRGLWDLRAELMQALADGHGERAARERLQHVTESFRDLLPDGLASCIANHPPTH